MEDDLKKKWKKMKTTIKKNGKRPKRKWKTNQSTKINLIGCDTIVNSPSSVLLISSHLILTELPSSSLMKKTASSLILLWFTSLGHWVKNSKDALPLPKLTHPPRCGRGHPGNATGTPDDPGILVFNWRKRNPTEPQSSFPIFQHSFWWEQFKAWSECAAIGGRAIAPLL